MGHLAGVRKNVRSTKETEPTVEQEITPPGKQPFNREQQVGIHMIDFEELKGVIVTDQTGHFPIKY